MARAAKKKKPNIGSIKSWTLTLVAAVIIAFLFLGMFFLIVVGMAPTICVFIIDRSPKKYFTLTVCFANGVGVLPSAVKLLATSSDIDSALEVISDPFALLAMYGAAAIGWFIHYMVPPFVSIWLSMSHEMKTLAIKKRQQDLVENWGAGIRDEAQKLLPDNIRLAEGIGEAEKENRVG